MYSFSLPSSFDNRLTSTVEKTLRPHRRAVDGYRALALQPEHAALRTSSGNQVTRTRVKQKSPPHVEVQRRLLLLLLLLSLLLLLVFYRCLVVVNSVGLNLVMKTTVEDNDNQDFPPMMITANNTSSGFNGKEDTATPPACCRRISGPCTAAGARSTQNKFRKPSHPYQGQAKVSSTTRK